jgi:starch phosphorylase
MRLDVKGSNGAQIQVYFLDTDLPENHADDRSLTHLLYSGDNDHRLKQEMVLGIGGVRLLQELGHSCAIPGSKTGLTTYHMNEGHAAFLTTALLEQKLAGRPLAQAKAQDLDAVKQRCVFTTHTPVPAGHDTFEQAAVDKIMGPGYWSHFQAIEVVEDDRLNMSFLALRLSRFTNGVAKRHGEVSRKMFPGHSIHAITNGVHAESWLTPQLAKLFDEHLIGWRRDNHFLRYAIELPHAALLKAKQEAKNELLAEISKQTGESWRPDAFTIGFARRAAEYKRGDLLFHQPQKLAELAKRVGGLQIVFSGKAHPKDEGGKAIIAKIVAAGKALAGDSLKFTYLENYDMRLGRLICGGVDLWLNNPVKPLEASGTSGMKAALNGVPSLSTLDGWWVEGCVEGVTGWELPDEAEAFGEAKETDLKLRDKTVAQLHQLLEQTIIPLYKQKSDAWATIAKMAIALNGSYFHTQRMMEQYNHLAYSN